MINFEEYSYRMQSGEEFVITMYFDVLSFILQTQFVFIETEQLKNKVRRRVDDIFCNKGPKVVDVLSDLSVTTKDQKYRLKIKNIDYLY